MAASVVCKGVSSLLPQPTGDPTKLLSPSPTFLNLKPKKPSRHIVTTVRADANYDNRGTTSNDKVREILLRNPGDYDKKYGFTLDIDSFSIPKGLSRDTIRLISSLKDEPEWMLQFRLRAFDHFLAMKHPTWSDNTYSPIDLQDLCYYSAPKKKQKQISSCQQQQQLPDPEILRYFDKLGVPLDEQKRCLTNVARSGVFDSVSVGTNKPEALLKAGVIFCSISEAVREYPDLVRKHMGKVVPSNDNYFAALNSAVFSDGSFCYIPKDTRCPKLLSTYFRINSKETGQFERTLIIADDRSFVQYFEGCTAPSYDRNQLHAAVVELYCGEGAEINYSTVQNWYPGDARGKGGVYNFVTKRGVCGGAGSKISWTQVEMGSAITWKYPSVVLEGDGSVGKFYSVAFSNNHQQADTGTKMIHKGNNTRSRIVSKGISAGNSRNSYRGLVQVQSKAQNAINSSQCDSMLIGDNAAANTYPYIQVKNSTARIEHEASTSKIGEDQLFYFQQRGIDHEKAIGAMIERFGSDVFEEFPGEFKSELKDLAKGFRLERSVG